MITDKEQNVIEEWKSREATAEAMIPLIGHLYRDANVVTSVFGQQIVNQSVMSVIKAHRFVRQVETHGLSVKESYPILEALSKLSLAPARIDIGKLAVKYRSYKGSMSVEDFVQQECADIIGSDPQPAFEPTDVVLYGFGRIGRLLARLLVEKQGGGAALRLRAVVVRSKGKDIREELEKRASLLRRDSIHGAFNGSITVDVEENALLANGTMIRFINADAPDQIDYTQYGIKDAIVVDNTGKWRDEEGLGLHLKAKGVAKAMVTAPGKGDMKNIVYGVNHDIINSDDVLLSAASCTTNAITPVLKALNDEYGVERGHVETVHAFTNDQNLIDNYHKGHRRGRSAAMNMVITETGAAKAVSKALPELEGKLTGNAIRVPTPDVSLAILNLTLGKGTDRDALNAYLRDVALYSDLQKQIDYVNSPEVVSCDFVGSRYASVVDSVSTIVNDDQCVLYIWYDNEFGYSCQVVRLLQYVAGVSYPIFPKAEA